MGYTALRAMGSALCLTAPAIPLVRRMLIQRIVGEPSFFRSISLWTRFKFALGAIFLTGLVVTSINFIIEIVDSIISSIR